MLYGIVYVVAFMVFLGAPLPLQILFFVFNIFFPDPIPILDEAFMTASILKKIATAGRVMEFLEEHKKAVKVIGIVIAVIIVGGIILFFI